MFDRTERHRYAWLLRQFAAGRITNHQWEDRTGSLSPTTETAIFRNDPAIVAIDYQVWFLYDDFKEHYLEKELRCDPILRKELARFILFLYSDQEFEWKRPRVVLIRAVYLLLTSPFSRRRRPPAYKDMTERDWEHWPFRTRAAFDKAKNTPVLLTGGSQLKTV